MWPYHMGYATDVWYHPPQEEAWPKRSSTFFRGRWSSWSSALDALGRLHGYGIARRIEQVAGNEVLLNQGTIYASLVRLQQRGWISAAWGTSDNNRRAKFYSLTKRGRKQLTTDAAYWERLSTVMGRVLSFQA